MFRLVALIYAGACAFTLAGVWSISDRAVLAQAQAGAGASLTTQEASRDRHLAALRLKAQNRVAQDLIWYSAAELLDIEAQYRSTRLAQTSLPDHNRRQILEALATKYPRSNRAGCAVVELAQMSAGEVREQYLKKAIDEHADAWFENGSQVGPLAMALLAMHYAGFDRLAEAERLAAELSARYPGSIDSTGASLDEVLPGLKGLRPPK
jgi:hypothetical protein